MRVLDQTIRVQLQTYASELELAFDGDVMCYIGAILPGYFKYFRNFMERLAVRTDKRNRLICFLNTGGGSVETVEKMVETIRHHYAEVFFVVPDMAMSAGTILCMSGDKVYMDYSSSLGPIDPQVLVNQGNGEQFVPALGYLDQVDRLIQKSADGKLTPAEFAILQNQDLALLRRYEQARDLSVDLLQTWLVNYKFRNWTEHRTSLEKKGSPVTEEEKKQRAAQIAQQLGDNKIWHSHGRMIGIGTLRNVLRLEIEDYTSDNELRGKIRAYNDLITEYVGRENLSIFLHSRDYF